MSDQFSAISNNIKKKKVLKALKEEEDPFVREIGEWVLTALSDDEAHEFDDWWRAQGADVIIRNEGSAERVIEEWYAANGKVIIPAEDGIARVVVDPNRKIESVNSPGQALTWHLELLKWAFGKFAPMEQQTMIDVMSGNKDRKRWGEQTISLEAKGRAAMNASTLNTGTTMYVSRQIQHLIEGMIKAYEGEPDSKVPSLEFTDLPQPTGLVVFESPFPSLSAEARLQPYCVIRAVSWRLIKPGTMITKVNVDGREFDMELMPKKSLYNDDGTAEKNAMEAVRQHGGVLLQPYYDGRTYIVGGDDDWRNIGSPPGLCSAYVAIPFTEFNLDSDPDDPERNFSEYRLLKAYFTFLMRLIWQQLLPGEIHRPNNSNRRKWSTFRANVGDIKVTHYRRYVPRRRKKGEGDGTFLLGTQKVDGHFKWQWYKTLGPAYNEDGTWNRSSHRRIWVDGYERGQGPYLNDEKYSVMAVVK